MPAENQSKTESPSTIRPKRKMKWARLRLRLLQSFLWIAIFWMAGDALSTWFIHQWLPKLIPIDKIQHEIQVEVARATQMEPVWDDWHIHPTLLNGLDISIDNLQLRDNPEALAKLGAIIPTPSNFPQPTKKEHLLLSSHRALLASKDFHLNIRYLPLIQKQHLQISHIQLNHLKLLAGESGVFNRYIPILYDPDYAKKYFPKKKQNAYLANASIGLWDVFVSQDSPIASLIAPGKHDSKHRIKPKTLPVDRVALLINHINIENLVSKSPLTLDARGTVGIFNINDSAERRPELNNLFQPWNRTFTLKATSRTTGEDPEKAFIGPWSSDDLKSLDLNIHPAAITALFSPESIHLNIKSVPKPMAAKNSKQLLAAHQWQLNAQHLDLAILGDTAKTIYQLSGKTDSAAFIPISLQGGTSFNAKGNLLWPADSLTPTVQVASGNVTLQKALIGYQSKNSSELVTPIINQINGQIALNQHLWQFKNLNITIGKSHVESSGELNDVTQALNAKLLVNNLNLNDALQSLSQFQNATQTLSPQQPLLSPDLQKTLAQWQRRELLVDGTINSELNFNGPIQQLDYQGNVSLDNGLFKLHQKSTTGTAPLPLDIEDIKVRIQIQRDIQLQSLSASVLSIPIQAHGTIDKKFQNADVQFTSKANDLSKVFNTLKQYIPADQKANLASIQNISGSAEANLNYRYKANQNSPHQMDGFVSLQNFALFPMVDAVNKHPAAKPVEFNAIALNFNGTQFQLHKTNGHWGPIPLEIQVIGQLPKTVKESPEYKATLTTGQLPISLLRDNAPFFKSLLPTAMEYPNFWNTQGHLSFDGELTPKQLDGTLAFHQAGASWENGELPLYGFNGNISIHQELPAKAQPRITTDRLEGRYGNSPLRLVINHDNNTPQVLLRGRLASLTLNHFLTTSTSVYANYEDVPFRLEASENKKHPHPDHYAGQIFVGLNRLLVNPPPETANADKTLELRDFPTQRELPKHRAFIQSEFGVNASQLLHPGTQNNLPEFELYPSHLHLSDFGDIWAEGVFNKGIMPFDASKIAGQLHFITTPAVDLKGIGENFRTDIFQGAKGELATDMTLAINPEKQQASIPKLNGWLELRELGLPLFMIDDLTGNIQFENQKASIDFPSVKFMGASLSVKADSPQTMQTPIPLENVVIQGSEFNLPAIQQFNQDVVDKMLVQNVVRRFTRPWQEGDALIPVEFKDASVSLNEIVYQNILMQNLKGRLTVLGNSFIQLSDTTLDLAGGKVSGYLEMNPFDNNFIRMDMTAKGVKANALTRALLGVSNQVFGDVDATIQYGTRGKSDQEMLQNANGTVHMQIANGRLPALSHVETLLTAANLLRGGILGFNFNNLIRTVTPFRAQYFAALSGDLLVADKKLHTENLLSDGKNLDLLMQGAVKMDDGVADMSIIGTMDQDVEGDFGVVGKFSLGRILRIIPILGFNPLGKPKVEPIAQKDNNNVPFRFTQDPGLLYRIPGLGYVPGLGGPAKDVNRFKIQLQGPPQDPASIKSFSWLKD